MKINPNQMPFYWLVGGYGVGLLGLIGFHSGYVAIGGFVGAIAGIILQTKLAQIDATNYSWWKVPLRSFFYGFMTEIKQYQISGDGVPIKGGEYKAFRTIFPLAAAETHPKYSPYRALVVEHDKEDIRDEVAFEKGEIVHLGMAGVPTGPNKVAIAELWETPTTYHIGASIIPVFLLPSNEGQGMPAYRTWLSNEFKKMDDQNIVKLREVLRAVTP